MFSYLWPDNSNEKKWTRGADSPFAGVGKFKIGRERIIGTPETDLDRTSAEGKASSVQFVHFAVTPAQIALFRAAGTQVTLGFNHPAYLRTAVTPESVRSGLAGDFD